MANDYDVIVAGLGAMGSAALCHLAGRGRKVAGFDRFHPPHALGSSHGQTRIIREAYFEHPAYVPLVQRAYALWAELERRSGRELFRQTGGLMIGPADGVLVEGAKRSAKEHSLPHEVLSAAEVRKRFPVLEPAPGMEAVWEPRAGILFPELAIEAQLELATGQGAVLHFDEPIVKWEPIADGLRVFTGQRSATAGRLLLSVGAWLTRLLPELNLPLAVERQVLFWFEPANQQDQFRPGQCPIHLWEYEAQRFFYGFPNIGHGVKAALHHQGQVTSPETVSRTVEEREVEEIRRVLQRFLPAANGRLLESAVCLYTNTPDEHFLLDFHPTARSVLIASPCSGHGFKFSPVIGEIAAQLLSEEEPQFDLSLFKIERLLR